MKYHEKYDINYDQEYPPFLRELKNYNDVEIHLVLIDPNLEDPPLCVCDSNKVYKEKFVKRGNTYIHNESNIYVYCYNLSVYYDGSNKWLKDYIHFCENNNYLLFLHDFLNRNLKTLINTMDSYDYRKIMLGISLVSEQDNCHMDMSKLYNQPVVFYNYKGNYLEIWTPSDDNITDLGSTYRDLSKLKELSPEMNRMIAWIDAYIDNFINPFIAYVIPIYRQLYLKQPVNDYILECANFNFNNIFWNGLTLEQYIDNLKDILNNFFIKLNKETYIENTGRVIKDLLEIIDLYSISSTIKKSILAIVSRELTYTD